MPLAPITIRYQFRPRARSLATGRVSDLFGLADDEPPFTVAEDLILDVRPGDLVLFSGASGGGKSSLLRAVGAQLGAIDAAALKLPDVPLVDALSGPDEQRLSLLAACGLSEARLLLRSPAELSDGQRYRFRLAVALNRVTGQGAHAPRSPEPAPFVLADEFAAVLDRTLAKVVAFNVRKLGTRTGVGFLLATTHDDLTDDLAPDLWVRCPGDGPIVAERHGARKKNLSASPQNCGSPKAPDPTGRISLGGIIAVIDSPTSSASCCSGTATAPSASASSARRPRR